MVAWIWTSLSMLTSELVNRLSVFVVVPTWTLTRCTGTLAAGLDVVGVAVGVTPGVGVPLPVAGVLVLLTVAVGFGVGPTVGVVAGFERSVVLGILLNRPSMSLTEGLVPVGNFESVTTVNFWFKVKSANWTTRVGPYLLCSLSCIAFCTV